MGSQNDNNEPGSSRSNPIVVDTSSQAGLASTRVRVGAPNGQSSQNQDDQSSQS